MANVVPTDSRYIPLTQQKWCCVPTCIQMVMLRRNIPLLPAEHIGYEMGLVVPEEAKKYFWNARTGDRPPAGYGTQISKPEYGPNEVFKRLNIPLRMTWSLIDQFPSIELFINYLSQVEKNDADILVCFDWPTLFNPAETSHWGHVCVLDKVDLTTKSVRIIDPEFAAPKWRVIEISKLYDSMVFHGSNKSGGFWELQNSM